MRRAYRALAVRNVCVQGVDAGGPELMCHAKRLFALRARDDMPQDDCLQRPG